MASNKTAPTSQGTVDAWPHRYASPGLDRVQRTDNGPLQFQPTLIARATYTDAAAKVANGISASHAGAGAAGTTNMTLGGSLAAGGVATLIPPRNVVITVTHASSIVAMGGTITGTDEYGKVITEDWAVTATGTTKTYTGKKAFKTVTQITETVAADASANSIVAGTGDVLGLPFKAVSPTIVSELTDGAVPTAGTLLAGSAVAGSDARGTFTPNQTPNGAKDFDVWFLVDDPTDI